MITSERAAQDWFRDAERCYVEMHQGCAWCGGSHRVFQVRHGASLVYYCNGCDFKVSHDQETGAYQLIPGVKDDESAEKKTMYEI